MQQQLATRGRPQGGGLWDRAHRECAIPRPHVEAVDHCAHARHQRVSRPTVPRDCSGGRRTHSCPGASLTFPQAVAGRSATAGSHAEPRTARAGGPDRCPRARCSRRHCRCSALGATAAAMDRRGLGRTCCCRSAEGSRPAAPLRRTRPSPRAAARAPRRGWRPNGHHAGPHLGRLRGVRSPAVRGRHGRCSVAPPTGGGSGARCDPEVGSRAARRRRGADCPPTPRPSIRVAVRVRGPVSPRTRRTASARLQPGHRRRW